VVLNNASISNITDAFVQYNGIDVRRYKNGYHIIEMNIVSVFNCRITQGVNLGTFGFFMITYGDIAPTGLLTPTGILVAASQDIQITGIADNPNSEVQTSKAGVKNIDIPAGKSLWWLGNTVMSYFITAQISPRP
jgi:hypothetical protein